MATEPTGLSEETAPPVVAVVVTRNPGPFLETALAALGAQDYPALSVLVVDAGSAHDPTARVGAALPTAFMRRIAGSPGFGGAANEGLAAVQGATFFVVCHDDVVLDPTAIRVMVEEAYRSNAAIVGPKLVDVENPEVILEVGRAIDSLGASHTAIEPGEIDQEQHDAVRDVFYVSSAAMLVRADLFDELGGFDPDAFPGSEDLDLCWRARLAGARVMVAPDARGRHGQAEGARAPGDEASRRELARTRVRVILTCYSATTLLRVVPFAVAVAFVEAIAFALTSRRSGAFAELGAWVWNLLHFGRLRPARRRAQALRRVRDRDLRELQVGASARAGAFLAQHHADERIHSLGERGRDVLASIGEFLRHPAAVALIAFFVLVIVGSRGIFSDGVPQVGTMLRWPSIGDLGGELASSWRHTGLGSDVVAPSVLALMAGLGTVLFGATGLAQTLMVVGAFAVGAFGAYRMSRALDGGIGGAGITALAYGVSAVPRNAIANGRLGPLVLYALAPFVALLVVRAGQFPGIAPARRPLLGLAIGTAVLTAWYPPAALLGLAVALAVLVTTIVTGDGLAALRSLGAAAVGLLGAALLLVPWTGTLLEAGSDRSALGVSLRPDLTFAEVLRFESGPNGAGIAGWGLLVAAAAALVIADGRRFAWATRAWVLAIVGYAVAVVPERLAPDSATVAPEAGLALAALGVSLAAGLGISAFGERLTQSRVGWAQAAGVLASIGILFASLGFVGDVFDGRWRAPESWASVLSFTEDALDEGEFRILWLGDAEVLPLDPFEVDATLSWSLTRNGPGDAREQLRAPESATDRVISRALRIVRAGQTSRLGRMLAPSGVRYLALARRNGIEGIPGKEPPGVSSALGNQLDLARLGSEPGLVLYENLSWAPAEAVLPDDESDAVPVGRVDPLASAVPVDLEGARAVKEGRAAQPGTLLLAEAFDDAWSARVGETTLPHGRAFGYTNAFTLDSREAVSFEHSGGPRRGGLLLFQAALWVVALTWWGWGRRRSTTTRARTPREEREERRRRVDVLDLADADDDFWEGR